MSNYIKIIHDLIPSLPNKDISLGYKFLNERNFELLKDLIDSAIYKIKNNLKTENPKKEYLEINMENLNQLKSEVDLYLMNLNPDIDMSDSIYNNVNENEFY